MALARRTESNGGGGDYADIPNLEAGEHEGRLVYVADLGLQHQVYKGEDKGNIQQIALGIEVVGQTYETEDGEAKPRYLWTKPFNIFATLTEKGNELKMYSVFDASANDGELPDWEAQLGKPCSIVVEHVHKDDKVYDNIKSVLPIPAKYQDGVEAASIEFAIGDSDEKDNVVNKALFGLTKFVFAKKVGAEDTPATNEDGSPSY